MLAEQRADSTEQDADQDVANDKECKADQDGQGSFDIVQVETLAYSDDPGDQRPDASNNPANAWDDRQELWGIGEADHPEHLIEGGLSAKEGRAHEI